MSDSTPNPVPVVGDCYEASFNNACELNAIKRAVEAKAPDANDVVELYKRFGLNNDVTVVHGWVSSPSSPDPLKRFHHAWIEVGDIVFETQGGTRRPHKKPDYYELFQAYPNQRYSLQEVADCIDRDKKYHAWRGKGPDKDTITTPATSAAPPRATS
jgi:hypothetical protein